MKVYCDVEEVELEGEHGRPVSGVQATCQTCDHTTESFGTSDRSIRRCLALMREQCPMGDDNFYEES